ncbi:MAG: TetR/AcrR family transcriptional regulator [Acidimicrobiales bacterium]|jgi:AcrR family transcriptional regulator
MKDGVDRRSRILTTAGELFAARGVQTTTVREIGDAVGVLSGSLYHYFDSKEEIVLEIVSAFIGELRDRSLSVAASTSEPVSCLRELFAATTDVLLAHQDACLIYQNDATCLNTWPGFRPLADQMREIHLIWAGVVEDGVEAGHIRVEVDPSLFAYLAIDSICDSLNWSRSVDGVGFATVANICTEVLLSGCLNQ